MLEKSLTEYSPQELMSAIEDHLENTPGFVGRDSHPALRFLQEETDKERLLRWFHQFAGQNTYMSYKALGVLSKLTANIIWVSQNNVVDPRVLMNAYSVVKNLSEEIRDPQEGKPHTGLWEDLRRDTAYLLGMPVENDPYIHFSSISSNTYGAVNGMDRAISDPRAGLLSLGHAEVWMVRENGIMLPAASRAGVSLKGMAAIRANMNADIGHGPASVEAAIELAQLLPVSATQMREVFDKSCAWRIKFYDQWENWVE